MRRLHYNDFVGFKIGDKEICGYISAFRNKKGINEYLISYSYGRSNQYQESKWVPEDVVIAHEITKKLLLEREKKQSSKSDVLPVLIAAASVFPFHFTIKPPYPPSKVYFLDEF